MRRNTTPCGGSPSRRVRTRHKRICAVVDVEKGSLRSLEEHVLLQLQCAMEENDSIGDKRTKLLAGGEVVLEDFFPIERREAVAFKNGVVLLDALREFCSEDFRAHEVTHAKTGPRGFVRVGGTDTAFGGADFFASFLNLAQFVQRAMVRQNEVGGIADEKVFSNLNPSSQESVDFPNERDWVEHNSIADDARF